MQAVFDTNVLVSALFWHGPPKALLEKVRSGSIALVSSPALLAELARVISRAKFDSILKRTNTSREQALAQLRQLTESVDPPPLKQPVCRDPDDDAVLPLAIAAKVDWIVSGDELSTFTFRDGKSLLFDRVA